MSVRSSERFMIKERCYKEDGNTKNFKAEWKKYHDAKMKARVEETERDGRVTAVRAKPKKKQHHYDNGKLALRQWRAMKEMIANMKKKKQEESAEVVN